MENNHYLKYRIVEKDGKYAIQGLEYFVKYSWGTKWLFNRRFFGKEDTYTILSSHPEVTRSGWKFLEEKHADDQDHHVIWTAPYSFKYIKVYSSYSAAKKALLDWFSRNCIEPIKQETENKEWKLVTQ